MNPVHRQLFRLLHGSRVRLLRESFALTASTTVLDLGGRYPVWADEAAYTPTTTLLPQGSTALTPTEFDPLPLDRVVELPWPDRSFDLLFCDGLLERAANGEVQRALAAEMSRVARGVFVRVMARDFPVAAGRRFGPKPDLTGHPNALLNRHELAHLFPDCEIVSERVLGMARSHIAIRRTEPVYRRQPMRAATPAAVTSSATPA